MRRTSYIIALLVVLILLFDLWKSDRLAVYKEVKKEEQNQSKEQIQTKVQSVFLISIEENNTKDEHDSIELKYCLKSKKDNFIGRYYVFDTRGKVESISNDRNGDGVTESKSFFTYDERENLIKVVTETYQEPEKNYHDDVSYSLGMNQDVPTQTSEVINEYDEKNRLISKLFDKQGFSKRIEYTYNENGDLAREIVYWDDALIFDFKVENSYDEKGRRIAKKYKLLKRGKTNNGIDVLDTSGRHTPKEYVYNDKSQIIEMKDPAYYRIFKYEYDEFGNRLKERIYRTKLNEEIIRKSNEISYTYDKYHNLMKKVDSYGNVLLKQSFEECE